MHIKLFMITDWAICMHAWHVYNIYVCIVVPTIYIYILIYISSKIKKERERDMIYAVGARSVLLFLCMFAYYYYMRNMRFTLCSNNLDFYIGFCSFALFLSLSLFSLCPFALWRQSSGRIYEFHVFPTSQWMEVNTNNH